MNEFLEFLGWWMLISVVVGVAVGGLIRVGSMPVVARPIANPPRLFLDYVTTAGSGAPLQREESACRSRNI